GSQIEGVVEEAFVEDLEVVATVEAEEVSSRVELITTMGLWNTIGVNALMCYNALGVERSI
ncbi:hypothetical protein KI387_030461, partial [Taxus chinensis]